MKLPLEPSQLPPVDQLVLDAVCIEHGKSTTRMAQTLRSVGGWSPVQAAFAEDHWSWSWLARAVVAVRMSRGLVPVDPALVAAQIGETATAKARAAEDAWEAEHGPTPPPRPPGSSVQIHLPPKPATTADASAYLPAAESSEESQGERI